MTTNSTRTTAAAIDIGSNSIKMTIGCANGEGGVDQLGWASEVVRLGQGLDRTGLLDEERIEAAIETLKRFAAQARERGAGCIVAVATEATRAAANGAMFLSRVPEATRIQVRARDRVGEGALRLPRLLGAARPPSPGRAAHIGGRA